MKAVFRVDASKWIGTGHVMRCLSLAEELRKNSCEVIFACLPQDGDMRMVIAKRYFRVCSLTAPLNSDRPINYTNYKTWLLRSPREDCADFIQKIKSADIVIVDHYAIGGEWHRVVKEAFACKIIVIDDLVRSQDADLVVDQTLNRSASDYSGRAKVLAGTNYALLASHFSGKHEIALDRVARSNPPKIMIYMGGFDLPNITSSVIKLLVKNLKAKYTVVLSQHSPHHSAVKRFCDEHKDVKHIEFSTDMASLMLENDIAIGAAGTTSWERACVGLPTITIPIAGNQADNAERLQEKNATVLVKMESISTDLLPAVKILTKNWTKHCKANLAICDGRGVSRLMLEIESLLMIKKEANVELVDATIEDIELVYSWQCMPETRKYALNPAVPSWMEHQSWMLTKLDRVADYFFIVKERLSGRPCGFIRLDRQDKCDYLVSILIAPEFHGKGFGLSALQVVDRIYSDFYIHAVVKQANTASQKLFQKAGYQKVSDEEFIRDPIRRDHSEIIYQN
jgi:UDP-2,4-diacetamido-2,4,6-trideoxy-beta-L-altropyranose hydrolase